MNVSTGVAELEEIDVAQPTEQGKSPNRRREFIEKLRKLPGREVLEKFRNRDKANSTELENGVRAYDLLTPEGQARLGKTLKKSKGEGLVIVHPYFQEHKRNYKGERAGVVLDKYNAKLAEEIRNSREQGLPLVLFETANREHLISEALDTMGFTGKEVFIVKTLNDDPEPMDNVSLPELTTQLHNLGLTKARVNGTQFHDSSSYITAQHTGDIYYGCAGQTLERLKDAGVSVTAGDAVLDDIV